MLTALGTPGDRVLKDSALRLVSPVPMPAFSLKGASNFTITGGNFGEIKGNVFTCNLVRPLGNFDENSSLPARSSWVSSSAGPSRRHERRVQRSKSRPTATQQPFLLPSPDPINTSSPITASSASISTTPAPASPTSQLPTATSPSPTDGNIDDSEDGSRSDSSDSSGYERYSTPLSQMEDSESGHQYSRPSDLPSSTSCAPPPQPSSSALLNPLTDTLNSHHCTPVSGSQTVSSGHGAHRVRAGELQPTYVDHNKSTVFPPIVAPQPRVASNFTHPFPHLPGPVPGQTLSSTAGYSHACHTPAYPVSYIQSSPWIKWVERGGAYQRLSRQNQMSGVCGHKYRCAYGHPATHLLGDLGGPGFPPS